MEVMRGLLRSDLMRAKYLLYALVVVAAIAFGWLAKQSYSVHKLTRGVGDTWFHTADGRRWFRLDEQRHDVPISAIAPSLQQAFVAVEDHRFFLHPGIDPIALGRALVRNVTSDSREGGSTLTQQLARTLFLSNRRSYGRKAREAVIAFLIEGQLSKEQILELYLNRIFLGAGIYGVEAMSQRVFGKPAKSLTLAESAMIAGLARAPAALSPWSNLDEARRRSHVVLARMREEGFITPDQEQQAKRAAIRVQPYRSDSDRRHGYAKAYLRQRFRDEFGRDHPPDWRVDTTFVAGLQDAAERAIENGFRRAGKPTLQAALVAINPETGDILALVGGRDYARSAFNRASRSRRQPGSAFKPFVFAAALQRGMSPVSVLTGLSSIQPQGPDEWTPRDVHDDAPDELTLRAALLESNNRAATLLQQEVGTRHVIRLASDSGLSDMPDVPSLALGAGLVTPLAITNAYAVFPNGGLVVRPRDITRVRDADGGTAFRQPVDADRVIKPEVAYQMVSMLRDAVDRGTGSPARGLGITFPVGGKTGTTNEFKDAWFVGFSSSIVAGVWVGYDQPQTIARDAYGARYALPIWADFMTRAARIRPPAEFERPAGLAEETLCAISYRKPVDGCPVYTELFKDGDDVPGRLCTLHRGSIRQRLTRTVEGWMAEAGRRVRGVFRW
ncbi:MAG TPA: PBP1A family penicillin-binding protein [Vicinamibacterales bacterium]|nr:PBP1A family penicillin-binding protein [Vicinamibacterales bacterium]